MALDIREIELTKEWIDEAAPHFEKMWGETGNDSIPLDVNYEQYLELTRRGNLLTIEARLDGRLVGYVIFIVTYAPHHQTSLQAVQDIFYVEEGSRRSLLGAGLALMVEAEEALKERGVHMIYQNVSKHYDFSPFLKRLGYEVSQITYQKRID